jgi:hypothetical protein
MKHGGCHCGIGSLAGNSLKIGRSLGINESLISPLTVYSDFDPILTMNSNQPLFFLSSIGFEAKAGLSQ